MSALPRSGLDPLRDPFVDSLIAALFEARVQVDILQGRLGIKDEGNGTLAIIDAALAEVERAGRPV